MIVRAKTQLKIFLCALSVCLASISLAASTLNELPLPDRTEARWVAGNNLHNGYTLSAKHLLSDLSVDGVLAFYRNLWSDTESFTPGFQETESYGWSIISRITEKYQWVVQVKPKSVGSGSEGYLSKMELKQSHGPVHQARVFTKPPLGGEEISVTQSYDPTQAQTQVLLYNGQPKQVARRVHRHYSQSGWSAQDQFEHKQTITLRLQAADRWLDISVVSISASRSMVLLNEVIRNEQD